MFTGIITDIGEVIALDETSGGVRVCIRHGLDAATLELGASVACNGVCLTVTESSGDSFSADVSRETLSVTTAKDWAVGTTLNLERALKAGDELGGHIVSGHVDGVASVAGITEDGDNQQWSFSLPEDLLPFVAVKGSITIDGVSLTINAVSGNELVVNLVPHTIEHTIFQHKQVGDVVNVEVDMLARYVARWQECAA